MGRIFLCHLVTFHIPHVHPVAYPCPCASCCLVVYCSSCPGTWDQLVDAVETPLSVTFVLCLRRNEIWELRIRVSTPGRGQLVSIIVALNYCQSTHSFRFSFVYKYVNITKYFTEMEQHYFLR